MALWVGVAGRTFAVLVAVAGLLVPGTGYGQVATGVAFRANTGTWSVRAAAPYEDYRVSEWSTTGAVEVRLGKYVYVGPVVRFTQTKGSLQVLTDDKERYWSYGGAAGGTYSPTHRIRMSAGVTYLTGDYCPCDDDRGFRRRGTAFLGAEARLAYFFLPALSVELGGTLQQRLGPSLFTADAYNFGYVGLVLELPGRADWNAPREPGRRSREYL